MITKTGLHAIRALVVLAELPEGRRAGASAVAEQIDAPPNYLGKLLQGMVREGLVESRKGPGGGFRLARAPREISLLNVVEPVENVSRWSGCFLGRPECSDESPCAMHERWVGLRDSYLEMLTHTTLADLMQPTTSKRKTPSKRPQRR